jgi:hypothetical protein
MINKFARMTRSEVFLAVKNHLLTQRVRSTIEDDEYLGPTCAYRGPNGLRCAAGCLIGDDEYTPDIEEKSWLTIVSYGGADPRHMDLIRALQRLHDFVEPDKWEQALGYVETLLIEPGQ